MKNEKLKVKFLLSMSLLFISPLIFSQKSDFFTKINSFIQLNKNISTSEFISKGSMFVESLNGNWVEWENRKDENGFSKCFQSRFGSDVNIIGFRHGLNFTSVSDSMLLQAGYDINDNSPLANLTESKTIFYRTTIENIKPELVKQLILSGYKLTSTGNFGCQKIEIYTLEKTLFNVAVIEENNLTSIYISHFIDYNELLNNILNYNWNWNEWSN